jgi:hypothetical protein
MTTPLTQTKIIADLAQRMDAMEMQQIAMAKSARETSDLVKEIYDALMKEQPGQDGSFLDRATTLLLNVESGSRLLSFLIGTSKLVIACGTLVAAWVAAVKFGLFHGGIK